jgi:dihydrofolate reductase
MSLDGFIAGAGGDMSWLTPYLTGGPEVDHLVESVGSLLVGRRTYGGDDPNAGTDAEGAFGGRWHGAVVVLTHEPPDDPVDGITFATDVSSAVAAAKQAAAGRYVNVLGADVARQCLEAGLLDEVLVIVAPVLLGDGTRLFDHPGGTNVALEPLNPDETGPLRLWFRVVR